MNFTRIPPWYLAFTLLVIPLAVRGVPVIAQQLSLRVAFNLADTDALDLPGQVDSNSPAVWSADGSNLQVFTSWGGAVQQAFGPTISRFGSATPVAWVAEPPGGSWMEAVVREQDVLYGYYHNEISSPDCVDDGKARPRIGAARSVDEGRTWEDLGLILESSEPSFCATTNVYVDGGLGDFSVMLDHQRNYLYVFFSSYSPSLAAQGLSVARMPWAARDEPGGALAVWQNPLWLPATAVSSPDGTSSTWVYPTGTPILPARRSVHSADGVADAFWGPSIHWNTYLRRYAMLLNHADSVAFHQEGIYVTFAARLDAPGTWSVLQRVITGGSWYPQVIGLSAGSGTDKEAGQEARFYMSGHSSAVIKFERPDALPPCPLGLLACTPPNRAR